jgi:hypothetical protein
MPKRKILSVSEIAKAVLEYRTFPSAELKYACSRYLASLHTTERRREAALQTPAAARFANAHVAIAARWSKRPPGELPGDHAAVMALLTGRDNATVTVKAASPRRRAAIAALSSAGRLRVVSQTPTVATLEIVPPK